MPLQEISTESRYRFKQLQDIEDGIEWNKLISLIEPQHLSSISEQTLITTEQILKIYFLQLRYKMSAANIEEALFKIEALRSFTNIEIATIPHEVHIQAFEKIIIQNKLEQEFETAFNAIL